MKDVFHRMFSPAKPPVARLYVTQTGFRTVETQSGDCSENLEMQTMATRLEPVFLTNVLLFIDDFETIRLFPFISPNCCEAMATIKTNPVGSYNIPVATTLRFFPNINTLRISNSRKLGDVETPRNHHGDDRWCMGFY